VRGGSYDLSAIAADQIERIEILKSASSAQFGADAMGGVVNIVTRKGGTERAALSLAAGGHAYRNASVRIAPALGTVRVSAGASRLEDGRVEDGGTLRLDAANLNASYSPTERSEVSFAARAADRVSREFPESSGGIRLARDRTLETRDVEERLASIAWRASSPAFRWNVRAATSQRHEIRDAPGIGPGPGGFVPALRAATDFRRDGVAFVAASETAFFASTMSVGAEASREDGRRDALLAIGPGVPSRFALVRDTRAAFAQLEANPSSALRLMAAARHDDVDPGGSQTSRIAGARWASGASTLRASYSEGFKPPSFFALGDALVGNPGLRPEKSRAIEGALEQVLSPRATLAASVFRTRYEDLVDFDPATFRMVNRAGATIHGAELELRGEWPGIDARASYTFAEPRLADATSHLRNRPRHRASASVAYTPTRPWTLSASASFVGRTFDFSIPTAEVELPGFGVIDLAATWRAGRWRATLAFDNATNRRYESFAGCTVPGARLRFGIALAL
jgi:iron complex outermembrane receptor protein/vitamin B12 transporter